MNNDAPRVKLYGFRTFLIVASLMLIGKWTIFVFLRENMMKLGVCHAPTIKEQISLIIPFLFLTAICVTCIFPNRLLIAFTGIFSIVPLSISIIWSFQGLAGLLWGVPLLGYLGVWYMFATKAWQPQQEDKAPAVNRAETVVLADSTLSACLFIKNIQ